jgi:hypothetical protein
MPARADNDPPHDGPYVTLDLSDPESRAAATGAAMAHVLSRPDSIRQRAQNAATISSAVAAALVIAALGHVAGGEESYGTITICLVVAAILLWAVSVAMFVYAVAFVDRHRPKPEDYQDLVAAYEPYADRVRQKMRRAAGVSATALIFTVLGVSFALGERIGSDTPMRLSLSSNGLSAVVTLCEWSAIKTPLTHIDATLRAEELSHSVVQVKDVIGHFKPSPNGRRPKSRRCTCTKTVRLPRSSVRGAIDRNE